jgi:hypothetical protein
MPKTTRPYSITFRYFPPNCLYVSSLISVMSNLEYASVVWNAITSTEAYKLKGIGQKFTSICFIVFPLMLFIVIFSPQKLSLHSLCKTRRNLEVLTPHPSHALRSCTSFLERKIYGFSRTSQETKLRD